MAIRQQKQKRNALKKLRPRVYWIYGIFNFKTKQLIFVSLDEGEVELKFDIEDYNEDYDIVSFGASIS